MLPWVAQLALLRDIEERFPALETHAKVSIGVATTTGEEAMLPAELLRRADERLYQAKHDGRNRVAA